jgi:endoglucanase
MYSVHNPSSPGRKRRLLIASGVSLLILGVLAGGIIALTNKSKDAITLANAVKTPALNNTKLYVDPASHAATQADVWRATRPDDAKAMDKLAALPTAKWFTSTPSLQAINAYVAAAAQQKAVPVLVAYNIPLRDCGQYSAGGAQVAGDYKAYIGEMASRIGTTKAIIILEPDAVAGGENRAETGKACLTAEQKADRYQLLAEAIVRLKKQPNVIVYLDAGNSSWIQDTTTMAGLLRKAGIAKADGFSLNVSNFQPTDDTIIYGRAISEQVGNKPFVIDTSRNGKGTYANAVQPDFTWCNPPGRALGYYPTTATGVKNVDAYLYIKYPGESDGQDTDPNKCFGGLPAGQWMPDYALGLIQRWPLGYQSR